MAVVPSAAGAAKPGQQDIAIGQGGGYLAAVSAFSASDVWAVGTSGPVSRERSLIEHWDGQSWSRVSSPSPGRDSTGLGAVAALAPDDAWAVGSYRLLGKVYTLVLHWDGVSWKQVSAPSPSPRFAELGAIYASSANDIWAVGSRRKPKPDVDLPLVEHWDGSSWQVVPVPRPDENGDLYGVTGTSSTDVTVVGGAECCREDDQPFAEHWDGSAWSLDYPISSGHGYLFAAYAAAPDDLWAVGQREEGSTEPLLEHWDGTAWSEDDSVSNPPNIISQLFDVNGTSGNDIWAVGEYEPVNGVPETMIEHWDGVSWTRVPGPKPRDNQRLDPLQGVTALSRDDAWTVGGYFDTTKQIEIPFIARWNGHKWARVAVH